MESISSLAESANGIDLVAPGLTGDSQDGLESKPEKAARREIHRVGRHLLAMSFTAIYRTAIAFL